VLIPDIKALLNVQDGKVARTLGKDIGTVLLSADGQAVLDDNRKWQSSSPYYEQIVAKYFED